MTDIKNTYIPEELSSNERNKKKCSFCGKLNSATCQIRTRRLRDDRLLALDDCCEDCKLKVPSPIGNDELEKCGECERIFRKSDYGVCKCEFLKSIGDEDENTETDKPAFATSELEKQIHDLTIDKEELEEELETEREAHLAGIEGASHFHRTTYEGQIQTLQQKLSSLEREVLSSSSDPSETKEEKRIRRLSNDNKELKYKVNDLETKLRSIHGVETELVQKNKELIQQVQEQKNQLERMETKIEQLLSIFQTQAQIEQSSNH